MCRQTSIKQSIYKKQYCWQYDVSLESATGHRDGGDNVSEVNYVYEAVNTYPLQTKATWQEMNLFGGGHVDYSFWSLTLQFITCTICCKW